jgi:hypothetical protein
MFAHAMCTKTILYTKFSRECEVHRLPHALPFPLTAKHKLRPLTQMRRARVALHWPNSQKTQIVSIINVIWLMLLTKIIVAFSSQTNVYSWSGNVKTGGTGRHSYHCDLHTKLLRKWQLRAETSTVTCRGKALIFNPLKNNSESIFTSTASRFPTLLPRLTFW